MGMTTAAKTALLNHIFKNLAWPNIGDAAGLLPSAAAGNFVASLHVGDPGAGGTQSTSEANYTGYARVSIARGAGWTVNVDKAINAAVVSFAKATGGSSVVTHWGIGSAASGAGNLLMSGPLLESMTISSGITPSFDPGQLEITAS